MGNFIKLNEICHLILQNFKVVFYFFFFVFQFVGTGFLALFVCMITDKRMEIPSSIHALLIGLLIAMIGMAFGMNVGYPINPARDFAPRVFAAMIGYGWEVFRYEKLI